jgi:hypothetical protein
MLSIYNGIHPWQATHFWVACPPIEVDKESPYHAELQGLCAFFLQKGWNWSKGRRKRAASGNTHSQSGPIEGRQRGIQAKMTVTLEGATLYIRAGNEQSGMPLEATAEDKFTIGRPGVAFEFDAGKGLLTIKRANGDRVFTKEK